MVESKNGTTRSCFSFSGQKDVGTSARVRLHIRDARGSIGFCVGPGATTETINETLRNPKKLCNISVPSGLISAIELHLRDTRWLLQFVQPTYAALCF